MKRIYAKPEIAVVRVESFQLMAGTTTRCGWTNDAGDTVDVNQQEGNEDDDIFLDLG